MFQMVASTAQNNCSLVILRKAAGATDSQIAPLTASHSPPHLDNLIALHSPTSLPVVWCQDEARSDEAPGPYNSSKST